MSAKIANPAKQFQFRILIPGLNPFLVQKVKSPDLEFEIAEHGDSNFKVKTAGIQNVGQVTIENIFDATSVSPAITTWMKSIGDTKTGGGAIPSIYKKNIVIEQLAPNGQTAVQRWVCEGAWPQKRNGVEFDRKQSDNTLESVEFCVDEVEII